MHRRTFIGSCASGLVTVGTVVEGQPASRMYRVGILLGGTAEDAAPLLRALTEALRDLDLIDGRNLMFEGRSTSVEWGFCGRLIARPAAWRNCRLLREH